MTFDKVLPMPRLASWFPKHFLLLVMFTMGCSSISTTSSLEFNRDIQPILANNCFQCHGPDQGQRKTDMRLDQEQGIRFAFQPGDLEASEAWIRITSDDPGEHMPPPKSQKELRPDEISRIRRWIEEGATWQGHWSFISPIKPRIPKVKKRAWVRNPIDAFVLARLHRSRLAPSPEANRERLLRRVSFDLTGLPPAIHEIDEFLADRSAKAYENVVDRLLSSSRFGERMALAWMDAARYADSSGFHADGRRDMWPWRDWVIRAYNDNKPFDQFTIEQLAGDLLPASTLQQKVATGFNRNNPTTDEGGAIDEEFRVRYTVDRVKTTSMVWLGLTMECAQCHDHKYDPISQRDYYRFFAYFSQASDPGMQSRKKNQAPVVEVPDHRHAAKRERLRVEFEILEQELEAYVATSTPQFENWLREVSEDPPPPSIPTDMSWHYPLDEGNGKETTDVVHPDRKAEINGQTVWTEGKYSGAFQSDGKNYVDLGAVGDFERTDRFSYGAWIKPKGKGSGTPIARLNDDDTKRGHEILISDGHVALHLVNTWPKNAINIKSKATIKPDQWQHVFVTYDGSSKAAGVKIYFDGKPVEFTTEHDGLSDTIHSTASLYLGRRSSGSPYQGLIDDVRVYTRQLTDAEVAALAAMDPIEPILAMPAAERTEPHLLLLRQHYLSNHDKTYQRLQEELAGPRTRYKEVSKPVGTVMVMQDEPEKRMTYVLARGDYASPNKDDPVEPGVPAFLPSLPPPPALSPVSAPDALGERPPDMRSNRLGLARWLVQPDHPLTARVTVNRYWYMLFGTGLVETVENFGSQGAGPTHPDLIDWLAVDFVDSGWDVKRMIKQIVMSSTYRQSSRVTPELWYRDPQNRLLARGPRFRLAGEFIRDNALAASGLLVEKVGGPSVKPYQPPGLWNEVSLEKNMRFVQDHDENLYRRGMYTYWKRSAPAPNMSVFDVPTREKCAIRRSRTNTPLQALVTLNDPQFVEAARALAERVMLAATSLEERVVMAHRLATGVRPRASVLAILVQAYEDELAVFAANEERTVALLAVGESQRNESLDSVEHAAMTVVASTILNLDEALVRG